MKGLNKIVALLALALIASGCKYAKVTTERVLAGQEISDAEKGKTLLTQSVKAMGYDRFDHIATYESDVVIDWRFPWGMMPMNPLPGAKNKKIHFRFLPNSFDGQFEHLEGRKKGDVFGLQSWEFYELIDDEYTTGKSPRREWGLATYHYLLEGPYRLLKADIIQYAGQKEHNGIVYDLVFATWNKVEPHKDHDQWLLYINPNTKMVDLANATIRDYFLPMPKNIAEGTVIYKRKKHKSGIYFPEEIIVQLMTPKKEKKHIYKMLMTDYQVDAFDKKDLQPIPGLKEYGDSKPITKK